MIQTDKRAEYVRDLWRDWADARKDWDTHAREDIDFYLGNHFSASEQDELESRNQSNIPLDRLYGAIQGAEHQGFLGKEGYSPWIRTKVKGSGSTAFGPFQLTGYFPSASGLVVPNASCNCPFPQSTNLSHPLGGL